MKHTSTPLLVREVQVVLQGPELQDVVVQELVIQGPGSGSTGSRVRFYRVQGLMAPGLIVNVVRPTPISSSLAGPIL